MNSANAGEKVENRPTKKIMFGIIFMQNGLGVGTFRIQFEIMNIDVEGKKFTKISVS